MDDDWYSTFPCLTGRTFESWVCPKAESRLRRGGRKRPSLLTGGETSISNSVITMIIIMMTIFKRWMGQQGVRCWVTSFCLDIHETANAQSTFSSSSSSSSSCQYVIALKNSLYPPLSFSLDQFPKIASVWVSENYIIKLSLWRSQKRNCQRSFEASQMLGNKEEGGGKKPVHWWRQHQEQDFQAWWKKRQRSAPFLQQIVEGIVPQFFP